MRQLNSVMVLFQYRLLVECLLVVRRVLTYNWPVNLRMWLCALALRSILLIIVAAAMPRVWQYTLSASARPSLAWATARSRKRSITFVLKEDAVLA